MVDRYALVLMMTSISEQTARFKKHEAFDRNRGLAIGVYAIGGLGIGTHTLQNDPNMLSTFRALFGRGPT